MNWFRKLPIKKKISVVVLISCTAAMLFASVMLFAYQVVSLRSGFVRDLASTAEMVGNSSVAAVSFRDRDSAREILRVLKAKPQIVSSRLELPDGSVFAEYGEPLSVETRSLFPALDHGVFHGTVLYYSHRVMMKDGEVARCLLMADYGRMNRQLAGAYLGILAAVLVIAMLLVWTLSARLQESISKPILDLARTSRLIAERNDYSVRAVRASEDELGLLTDAFNQMLSRIEDQDAALKRSQERYQLAVSGANDGLWDWDLRGNSAYFSPRWKEMLGEAEAGMGDTIDDFEARLHPEERDAVLGALREHIDGVKPAFNMEFRMRHQTGRWVWIHSRGSVQRDAAGSAVRFAGAHTDITARREADAELARLNHKLQETSRQAGMAEVATGVLHNVGNVLNSVNVSAGVVAERLRSSRLGNLAKVSEMLAAHASDLPAFLTQDPKGRVIPAYLQGLSEHLAADHAAQLQELDLLVRNVDHIKQIVAMQQSYAKVAGVMEPVQPSELVEDALQIAEGSYAKHRIELVREFHPVPDLLADRHRTLQILVNLLNNAKQALDAARVEGKRVVVRIARADEGRVRMSVIDNGTGIDPANLARIFQHGFTTKKEGHGFGLHSGANAAREMGGRLVVHSDGLGKGASFTLELPVAQNSTLRNAA